MKPKPLIFLKIKTEDFLFAIPGETIGSREEMAFYKKKKRIIL